MSQKDQGSNQEQVLEEPEIIYIPDDEGNEEEFEVIMKFEVDGSDNKYMMVVPVDADEESDEVYAFRYEEDGDDLQLYTIEDEDEWNIVEETFNTLMDEFDEDEEESK
ncbi:MULTISPECIES: DUF1292 domain-containing protein [Paenibacillus]|uniref:UPF0473 protein IJ22_27820 n=1 Tax=Paenibacillus naphthalenovorans TaxID=162209 RepID=A0A0U2VID3_9BACL|nr:MULTISPECIES: DUF1292 domain-containing protein [Paenibacillus]ALS23155.1 hypothetical protein IJ22_27820 [Paenibacillus naphthalenovorans]NTZ17240.1 DUF1292 domain-containing protein [Paenibacillus sp. JMULE4]GCL71712.1 DUF1292 domain-containing protein [Paenibacillus naphthalenovorans]SDI14008.1 Protein of unknown function [Paenibacillus naphthalenovorans]